MKNIYEPSPSKKKKKRRKQGKDKVTRKVHGKEQVDFEKFMKKSTSIL